jgi:tetratricopeptide (TPR) repeat protein
VRARNDLAGLYGSFASILLEEQPAEALELYQQAAAICDELSAAEPSNTAYRLDVALTWMGIGESLHKLGRNGEAISMLERALEIRESLAGADPNDLSLTAAAGRMHRDLADVLLAGGETTRARESYQQALAAGEELIRRAPSNLYFQRQHADALESLGLYYRTLARSRPEHRPEARQWLEKSQAVWQDWTRRNVATPYAGVRERRVAALIASIDAM